MSRLTLVYFGECPNAEKARRGLEEAGVAFDLVRQDELSAEDPFRQYASPTILRGGEVLFGARVDDGGSGCSLEVPTPDAIREKLGLVSPKPRR